MKIGWLITNVTAAGSPSRAKRDFFGDFDIFLPIQAAFVIEETLCDMQILS